MLKIKTIEKGQIQEVAEIHVRGWQEGYKGLVEQNYLDKMSVEEYCDRWQSWVKEISPGLIAYKENKAVGFISFGPIRTRPPGDRGIVPLYAGEIYALYVLPEYWQQGVGKALMRAGFEKLSSQKTKSVLLWVLKKNERAMRFYQSLGGQRVGKVRKEIGGRMMDESAIGWRDTKIILDKLA